MKAALALDARPHFGEKFSVYIIVSAQIGMPSLPDTWATQCEQCGGMRYVVVFVGKVCCHRLPLCWRGVDGETQDWLIGLENVTHRDSGEWKMGQTSMFGGSVPS